jgi:hypothetical protein
MDAIEALGEIPQKRFANRLYYGFAHDYEHIYI